MSMDKKEQPAAEAAESPDAGVDRHGKEVSPTDPRTQDKLPSDGQIIAELGDELGGPA